MLEMVGRKACRRSGCESSDRSEEGSALSGHDPDDSSKETKKRKGGRLEGGKSKSPDLCLARLL
jgi:hypothetical protein